MHHTLVRAELAALAAERAELWSDAAALVDIERDLASLEHRWQRAIRTAAPLIITCTDGHIVRGHCIATGPVFLVLDTDLGRCAINRAHLTSVQGLPYALADESEPLSGRIHTAPAPSALSDIVLTDGRILRGSLSVTATDHVDLQQTDHQVLAIAHQAIIRIQWRY